MFSFKIISTNLLLLEMVDIQSWRREVVVLVVLVETHQAVLMVVLEIVVLLLHFSLRGLQTGFLLSVLQEAYGKAGGGDGIRQTLVGGHGGHRVGW